MLHTARTVIQPQQSIQPTATINNHPYVLVVDEATTNLIVNPSFEVNVTDGWSATTEAVLSRNTTEKYSGDASMRVVVSGATAAGRGATSATIPVSSSTKYITSFWAKGNAGGEALAIYTIGNVSGTTNQQLITLSTSWERYFTYFVTGGSDTTTQLRIATNGVTNPTFFIDGVQFEQKTYTGYYNAFPTSYCDGSLGLGYAWNGTAHNSTSTRLSGVHTLAPGTAGSLGGLTIKRDGSLGGSRIRFELDGVLGANSSDGSTNNTDIRAPFYVKGDVLTFNEYLGNESGLLGVYNTGNGAAAVFKSGATTSEAFIVDGGSVTTGTILGIFAPSSLANFTGSFLKFADKSGANSYNFQRNAFTIGAANLNYEHYIKGMGAGMYAQTSTTRAGTISSSGTTVTGSGTSFTTEYSVGDIIVSSGQERVITGIASNTSLTTLTAFSPSISGGSSHSRKNSQYEPFFQSWEESGGDHETADYGGKLDTLFINNEGRMKIIRPTETAGASTISSSGTTVTAAASAFSVLTAGDTIIAGGQRVVVLSVTSNTVLITRTAFNPVISAGTAWTYLKANTVLAPTADTDGKYFVLEEFKDTASKTTTSNTSEQSIFTTTPTIPGGRMGASGTLEVNAFGTFAGAGATKTLTIRVKLGSTTILTTHAETIANTNAHNWDMRVIIQNTATNAQKTSLIFTATQATSGSAIEVIQDYETAAVNTALDQALDISIQWGTVSNTFTKESIIGKIW